MTKKLKKYQLTEHAEKSIEASKKLSFVKNAKVYKYAEMTDARVEQLWQKIDQSSIYELVPQKVTANK